MGMGLRTEPTLPRVARDSRWYARLVLPPHQAPPPREPRTTPVGALVTIGALVLASCSGAPGDLETSSRPLPPPAQSAAPPPGSAAPPGPAGSAAPPGPAESAAPPPAARTASCHSPDGTYQVTLDYPSATGAPPFAAHVGGARRAQAGSPPAFPRPGELVCSTDGSETFCHVEHTADYGYIVRVRPGKTELWKNGVASSLIAVLKCE